MHKTNPGKCIEIKCGLGYVCVGFYLFFAKLCCRRRALASPPSQQYKLLLLTLSCSLCGVSCCWVEFSYDKTSIDRAKYLQGQSTKFDLNQFFCLINSILDRRRQNLLVTNSIYSIMYSDVSTLRSISAPATRYT